MTVVPLVVSLLITRIASTSAGAVGRIGGRALFLFAVFAGSAAVFAAVAAPPLILLVA